MHLLPGMLVDINRGMLPPPWPMHRTCNERSPRTALNRL